MNKEKEIRSIGKLITLHLLPGIVFSIVYTILSMNGILAGFPKLITAGLTGVVSILPIELGYLFYRAKKEDGSYNIFRILGLKSRMKAGQYTVYTLLLFLITGLFMMILRPVSDFILNNVFCWIPSWYNFSQDMSVFSKSAIIITILVSFFFFTLIMPIVEELYFRGYLMARMKWMGKYSVLFNVVLFAVYHFWSPWLIIARIVGMIPLYYCVYKRNSLKLAIVVHCLVNFMDVVSIAVLL